MENKNNFTTDFHIQDGILTSYTGRDEIITVPENVHTIGEEAFKACVSLKKVTLPSRLTHILSGAFKGCRKLQEIQIPPSVSHIGDYAFHRCHALKTITLPPSVDELGDCVFLYCDSLTHVQIPGVRRLGKQVFVNDVLLKNLEISPYLQEDCICDVFTGCSQITDISFPDGRHFHIPNAVEAVAGNLEIPSLVRTIAVDILRIMELDQRCLVKFLTNLKHADIPEGIEKIGKSCFFDKRGIISVTLPVSLKEIESRAFRNCISLETVSFGQSQVTVHEDAFKNCSSLKEIRMPDQTAYAIDGIMGISGEHTPPLVKVIRRQVLGNFRISGSVLFKYLGSESRVVIPHGITSIAEEAFAGNEAIDRVILPTTLKEIGAGAFRDCLLLQTIEFPANLEYIGTGAFENCVKLLRALLPEPITQIEEKVFKHCHELKEVHLGQHIQTMGEQAFYGCSSLKEIHFPDSLTSIGEMAFYRCKALKEISLLPSIEEVGNLAFAQSGVKKIRISGNGEQYGSGIFFGCLRLRTAILEQGVRHIPDKLAYGCTSLKQALLPHTLESIGQQAFEHTPYLENEMPSDYILWDGRHCQGEFHIPEGTRIVAGGAFYGNTRLTALYFPDTVTWVGPAALKGCTCLKHVIWPAAVTAAEPEVFSGCTSLETVQYSQTSPAPVPWKSVKKRAFYNCRKLTHISLRHTETVGKEAFMGCIRLAPEKADFLRQVGENAFEHTPVIEEASPMTVMGTILVSGRLCTGEIRLPQGITAIAPFAFSGNRRITKLFLPDTLNHIGDGAFWGCSGLTHISFPSSPCTIGARSFEKCTGLTQVQFHAQQIGTAAFAYCTSLKNAELKGTHILEPRVFEGCGNLWHCACSQVSLIRQYSFSGCTNLTSIDLGTVKEIGNYAFQNCDSLGHIVLNDHTLICPHAFEDCGRLEKISLIGNQAQIRLREYAFSGCTALNQVDIHGHTWELHTYKDILSETIPEIARLIFHSAFSCFQVENEEVLLGYKGLGHFIKIPAGIKRIEAEVFRDILMLQEITIPPTVEYIGARAFHGTAWLEKQRTVSPMVIVNHMLIDGSCCTGDVTVPKDIRLVCGWAFAGGMGIKKIRFLSHRTKVEPYAFRNCIYLRELVLPDQTAILFEGIHDRKKELPPLASQAVMDSLNCFKTNEQDVLIECTGNISRLSVAYGITAIGDNVFQDGNLLTEITLPLTVTSIGKNAFAGCKWLKTVWQAQNVTSIGDKAFSGCGILEEIQLSENLRSMGIKAFENCTSLKEILLPEGLEEIPDKAFFRCHSLQNVRLPSTLKRIGKEAFAYCRSLQMPSIPEGVLVEERAFAGIR